MEEKKSFKPVQNKERIHVLDALRGFAIFGILIINIRVFSGYAFMADAAKNELVLARLNTLFDWLHAVFFSGKFYSLFSLLFGIGFAIQFIRASAVKRSFKRHFSRRLFVLLLIGGVDLWGIWFSDILVLYALCGYILLLFKSLSDRQLLWAAFIILLLPGLHSWYLQTADGGYTNDLYLLISESWNAANLPKASGEQETFVMEDIVEVIQSGSWSTVLSFNAIGPLIRLHMILADARMFRVLALFITGLWAGRQLLKHQLHENRPFLKRVAAAGLLIGIPLNLFFAMSNPFVGNSWLTLVMDTISPFAIVSLASAYAALFMLLYQTRWKKTMTSLFDAVGKTALSNYIFQSVCGIFIFYGAGLGLGIYPGSALLTVAVAIIFIFQIYISRYWLQHYTYGPLEWLWRVLTYGRYFKNRKKKKVVHQAVSVSMKQKKETAKTETISH